LLRSIGSWFHVVGPTTEKERVCIVWERANGTTKLPWTEDRSIRRSGQEESGRQSKDYTLRCFWPQHSQKKLINQAIIELSQIHLDSRCNFRGRLTGGHSKVTHPLTRPHINMNMTADKCHESTSGILPTRRLTYPLSCSSTHSSF